MLIETEKEDNRIFLIILGCIVFSFIIGWVMNQNHYYKGTVCREKGGVYVTTQHENLCLKKDIVIQ